MAKSLLRTDLKQQILEGKQEYSPLYVCAYCKRTLDPPGTYSNLEATKDHPQPRVKGGAGITVWACWTCNNMKGEMSYSSWKLFIGNNPRWWSKWVARGKQTMVLKEEEESEVIPLRRPMTEFKLITGGQPPSTGNWLLDLPINTRFTVRSKIDQKNFMCLDLELVNKTARTAMLWELSSGNPLGGTGRVDPNRFVQLFEKLETLPSYEEMLVPEEETVEINHGTGDRTSEPDIQ